MNTPPPFFPFDVFPTIRPAQEALLDQFEKTTQKYVVIQAPVATGKSAIAIALLNRHHSGYILTPRKFLQDQYAKDFPTYPILKGKKNYPCHTHNQKYATYRSVQECPLLAKEQKALIQYIGMTLYDSDKKEGDKPTILPKTCCPYYVTLRQVMDHPRAICNFHSFWFNGPGRASQDKNIQARLSPRAILIIDEAHELEQVLRQIATFQVKSYHLPAKIETLSAAEWIDFLTPEIEQTATEEFEQMLAGNNVIDENDLFYLFHEDTKAPDLERYLQFKKNQLNIIEKLESEGGFVVKYELVKESMKREKKAIHKTEASYLLTWIPLNITAYAARLFDQYERVVFMSGTIYNIEHFSAPFGLNTNHIDTIHVDSPIPAKIRPIYCDKAFMVNTSYAQWAAQQEKLIHILVHILTLPELKHVKGLIHTTSYQMAREITKALEQTTVQHRIMTHHERDFDTKLNAFFTSQENEVFISPICAQGIDFKNDRARFQIIIRVPYPNQADAFYTYQYHHNMAWINYQTLVTFGQQIGRINRHETDSGITFLLDSRFYYFLQQNKQFLPNYIHQTILSKYEKQIF